MQQQDEGNYEEGKEGDEFGGFNDGNDQYGDE